MGKTAGNSSKSERFSLDRNGLPIPVLGFSDSDTDSIVKSAAVTTSATVALTIGNIYEIIVAQADTADSGILVVDVNSPSGGAKTKRYATLTGMIRFVLKAREVDFKVTHVASPNTTGFIISVARLA